MAIPSQPTATTIVTEALNLFGKSSPTAAEITRATDYGLEIVKGKVMDEGANWDFLRTTFYQPTTAYVSKYQAPTDFHKLIDIRVGEGEHTGTAQAGAAGTITLASTYTGDPLGKEVVTTGGTGPNQKRQVKSYDSSTKVATLDENWTTTPDNTTTYIIIDKWHEAEHVTVYRLKDVQAPSTLGRPLNIFHLADSAEGDFYCAQTPDKVYILEENYYAHLLKVDLSSTLYSRFLRLMNDTLIQGVFVWALQDDSRHAQEAQTFKESLARKAALYLYPNNISDQQVYLDVE